MGTHHRFSRCSWLSFVASVFISVSIAAFLCVDGYASQDGGISSGFDFDNDTRNDKPAEQTAPVEETPAEGAASQVDIALKARLEKLVEVLATEPYATWFTAVKAKGGESPSAVGDENWPGGAVADARIAKCAALAYALTNDRRMLDSFDVAMRCLESVQERAVVDNDLLAVCNIAQDSALALMFVRSRLGEKDDLRRQAVWISASLAGMLSDNRPEWYDVAKNNWGVRQYSALLTCALVLESEPTFAAKAKEWHSYCNGELPKHIDYQLLPGVEMANFSGWAEGHGYLEYSLDTLLDCIFVESLAGTDNLNDTLKTLVDLSRWSVASGAPDGSRPFFDDSAVCAFPSDIVSGLVKDADPLLSSLLVWDYARQSEFSGYRESDPTLALLTYDSAIPPIEPRYEDDVTATGMPPLLEDDIIFEPEPGTESEATPPPDDEPDYYDLPRAWYDNGTGDMVMRSGWEADDSYLMMRIESGNAHWHGAGHEHWDPLNVLFYASHNKGNEWVLLDGGYPGWEKHQQTNTPDNHNVLLVNKGGADWTTAVEGGEVRNVTLRNVDIGIPGYTGGIPHGFIGGAETGYRNVTWRRDILFVKDDFVLIRDRIEKTGQGEINDLRIPWHINFGTDRLISDGIREPQVEGRLNHMYFELPSGGLSCLEFATSSPVKIEFRTDNHAFRYGKSDDHWVAEVVIPVESLTSEDSIYPVDNAEYDVFPKGGFTMYTLVGVGDGAGYFQNWDPPESVFNIISQIWSQTIDNREQ